MRLSGESQDQFVCEWVCAIVPYFWRRWACRHWKVCLGFVVMVPGHDDMISIIGNHKANFRWVWYWGHFGTVLVHIWGCPVKTLDFQCHGILCESFVHILIITHACENVPSWIHQTLFKAYNCHKSLKSTWLFPPVHEEVNVLQIWLLPKSISLKSSHKATCSARFVN